MNLIKKLFKRDLQSSQSKEVINKELDNIERHFDNIERRTGRIIETTDNITTELIDVIHNFATYNELTRKLVRLHFKITKKEDVDKKVKKLFDIEKKKALKKIGR